LPHHLYSLQSIAIGEPSPRTEIRNKRTGHRLTISKRHVIADWCCALIENNTLWSNNGIVLKFSEHMNLIIHAVSHHLGGVCIEFDNGVIRSVNAAFTTS